MVLTLCARAKLLDDLAWIVRHSGRTNEESNDRETLSATCKPAPGGTLNDVASTTLAECGCATVFQGFVSGNTGTAETAVEG